MRLRAWRALLIAITVVLSACGETDAKKAAGQVAAVVNGKEVSVYRVASAVAGGRGVRTAEAGAASAQALEHVVDQELLVQQALKSKLDRDPQVMQSIEDAKRQILARAYIDHVVAAAPSRSAEQIDAYYRRNPALFEHRRIYHLQELVVAAPQEDLGALQAAAAAAKGMDEVAAWLKSRGLSFTVVTTRKPAEQIPLEILPQVYAMRAGQIAAFSTARGTSVVQVLRSEEAPLGEKQATPVIERFLLNRERLELARTEVGKLRAHARIEYFGEFRPAPEVAPGAGSGAHIENGIAGLK